MAFDMVAVTDGTPDEWQKWLDIQRAVQPDPPPPYGLLAVLLIIGALCVFSY